jgi:putative ABC transport system ATP-binding protein
MVPDLRGDVRPDVSASRAPDVAVRADMVEIRGVRKTFRKGRTDIVALDGIDLSIGDGEFLALMGPSGSGKSTLLNLIGGLDRPTSGLVRVAGEEVSRLSESELARWRASHLSFVFQSYNLVPVVSVFRNVELPLLLTTLSKRARRDHVMTALQAVGMTRYADRYPDELSGGEEQRIAIARAIVADPQVLLADEPTGDLDAASARDVLTLLERLNGELKKTIVMVTHDVAAARRAHRIRHLEKGVLVRDA